MKSKQFKLVIRTKGDYFEHDLDEAKAYLIGRDPSLEIRLDDERVSSRHARLMFSGDNWLIEDLGSTNGTFIEGERVSKAAPLRPLTKLVLGSASLEMVPIQESKSDQAAVKKIEMPPGLLPDSTPKGANYQVVKEIAHGGMGEVHLAEDRNLKRAIAIKKLLGGAKQHSPLKIERFVREAQILGKLEHPNIVPIHELGVDAQGEVFYSMKLVKGTTLEAILQAIKEGKKETITAYPLDRLLTTFQKICDAVAYAHSHGVLHRDLKPENIMLGDFGEVLVMDWGLAKIL